MALSLFAWALGGCAGGKDPDDTGASADPDPVVLPEDCSALPMPGGATVVSTVADLRAALADARSGGTVALSDGTYDLSDGPVEVPPGVTLRSASGAGAVVLEGGYAAAELVQLETGATVAELTLSRSYGDAVVARGRSRTRVYGVHVVDPGGRAVAILPERGVYSDAATIGCVTVTRTEECAVGVEGVQTNGSRVYGLAVHQLGCDAVGVKFATGSKGTVIERSSVTTGGAVAFQLGDEEYDADEPRVYPDAPCPDTERGHYGGVVRNVFAVGGGIRVEDACDAVVQHTSAWPGTISSSFADDLVVANNLAALLDPGGSGAAGNLTPSATDFVDASAGDLHLAEGSVAIDAAVGSTATDDIDGDARDATPDVGGDERR